MTRRERLVAKIEQREAWAAGRREKASALYESTERHHGDIAFNTQPGHIPERARVIARIDRAGEHVVMANHHEAKAAGLARQLDRTVFSDDDHAIAALEARIAEHEATRERMKRVNALYKKRDAVGLAALGLDLEQLTAKLAAAGAYWGSKPHLPYELSNLGTRITTDRKRIEDIKARHARTERAVASGGVLVETGDSWHGWCRVTFAEKPDRGVLDDLRAAGYRWGGGHWAGEHEKLPASVSALVPVEVRP